MTKRRKTKSACHAQPWADEDQACFSIWLFFLLSADTPFIPVHRTGFSGIKLMKIAKLRNKHFPLCILHFAL
jgi:hypothetical protein